MKAALPFLLFTVLYSSAALAQCGSASSSSSSESENSRVDDGSSGSGSGSDYSGGGAMPVPLRIGYGRRFILQDYTKFFSDRVPAKSAEWLTQPDHVFDFSYSFGKEERFSLGSSFYYKQLSERETSSQTYKPSASVTPAPGEKLHQLETGFRKSASTFGQTLNFDYAFLSLAEDRFRVFAHADAGYQIYDANATITYFDTCGCSHVPVKVDGNSTVATTSLAVGMQFQYTFVGVKAQLGYQFQQANTFVTRQQYDAWQPKFNDAAYSYSGVPDSDLFSITGSEFERVRSRTNLLYFQLTGYFYFGWTRDVVEVYKRRAARKANRM